MVMSADDRRELRRIEQALSRSDPRLAGILAGRAGGGAGLVSRVAGAFVAVVVALISTGLVLGDDGMVVGGCLVLLMMPITVCLIAAVQGR